ncbi:glycosyltransferase [Halomonas litopenaei]|uniref:glycosyltransferase n=1 Tax=Halomonas litopenaei TaxID=2109328 RepID=UPI001A8CAAAF|nr:glycosyltransferase [Halomonas litopenaei]MBN8410994.1 glycosyltransferase family 4 protein [Halomonas litopenaei]
MHTISFFLGEELLFHNGNYYTSSSSASFLINTFRDLEWEVVTHSREVAEHPGGTKIDSSKVVLLPHYEGILGFVKKTFTEKSFFSSFLGKVKQLATDQKRVFWVRNPTLVSLIFSVFLVLKKRYFVSHVCADIRLVWKNKKYKGFSRYAAYLFSKLMHVALIFVTKSGYSINLATGTKLHKFCLKHDKNSTYFIDSIIEPNSARGKVESASSEVINLLFVGRVREDKGVFDLLEAMRQLVEEGEYKLLIVGGGELEKVRDISTELCIDKHVKIAGPASGDALKDYFAKSDAVIVPSDNDYEGFPRVILEAWSHNKPVFLTPVGGIPGLAKDGFNSIFIERGKPTDIKEKVSRFFLPSNSMAREVLEKGICQTNDSYGSSHWASIARTKVFSLT